MSLSPSPLPILLSLQLKWPSLPLPLTLLSFYTIFHPTQPLYPLIYFPLIFSPSLHPLSILTLFFLFLFFLSLTVHPFIPKPWAQRCFVSCIVSLPVLCCYTRRHSHKWPQKTNDPHHHCLWNVKTLKNLLLHSKDQHVLPAVYVWVKMKRWF